MALRSGRTRYGAIFEQSEGKMLNWASRSFVGEIRPFRAYALHSN